jgi:hypothetical protein
VNEGDDIHLSLTDVFDPSSADVAAGLEYAFDCGDGARYGIFSGNNSALCLTEDNGSVGVKGKIRDKDGGVTEYTATVTVSNVAPQVGAIVPSASTVAAGSNLTFSASFIDPGTADSHSAVWNWGDGTSSAGVVNSANGTVTGAHTYVSPGFYAVTLTVTDNDGGSGQATYQTITAYNIDGHVTGGGSINLEKASCVNKTYCRKVGEANFGNDAQYPTGGTVPVGQTTFSIKSGGLSFYADQYDILIVVGGYSRYSGQGLINDKDPAFFEVTMIDGEYSSTDAYTADRFGIRIWTASGTIVDTSKNSDSDANGTLPLTGGNATVH